MKTLVLGASLKEERYSNKAIKSLVAHNNEVIALGLREGKVAGIEIKSLQNLTKNTFKDIHTITLYLNPKRQVEYYPFMLSVKPQRVIFNPGTENKELVKILKENNIDYEIACTLVLLSIHEY